MRRSSFIALSIVFLNNPLPAFSQTAQAFYSGTFTCSDNVYQTDWLASKSLDGGIAATVYYQQKGYDRVNWVQVTEGIGNDASTFKDENGTPLFTVSPADGGLTVRWTKGAPAYNCETPFLITKTESPKARFDALFAMLEVETATTEQASKVSELIKTVPIIFTLPELDQQSYMQRLNTLKDAYWTRYNEQTLASLNQISLATSADRKQVSNLLTEAISGNAFREISADWLSSVYDNMKNNLDQHMIDESASLDGLFAGGELLCKRLKTITTTSSGRDFKNVEIAAGLPTEYWTRNQAEEVLQALRSCDEDSHASRLAQTWPKIEQQQELLKSLRAEQRRLLTLPVTLETFIETKNLSPSAEITQSVYVGSSEYKRFFGDVLAPRRDELLTAALSTIDSQNEAKTLQDEQTRASIQNSCSLLKEYSDSDVRMKIFDVCNKVETNIASIACEQVITSSGIGSDLLNATIEVYDDDNVSIRDLICKFNSRNNEKALLTIETSGALMWKKHYLRFNRSGSLEDADTLTFLLEKSAKGADWALTEADDKTRELMSKSRGPGTDRATACFIGARSCGM